MKHRVVNIVYLSLAVTTICLSIFLSIVCIYVLSGYLTIEDDVVEEEFSEYQTLHFDPLSEEFSFGMTTLRKELGEGDFIFSSTQIENQEIYELISPFGEEEYICTGRCFCDEGNRRSGETILSRGLTYLLVSVSSVAAYDLARKYFVETCANEYSSICSDSLSIMSEVVDCEEVIPNEIGSEEDLVNEDDDLWTYRCKGNCEITSYNHFYAFYQRENLIITENEEIYKGKKSLAAFLPGLNPTEEDLAVDRAHEELFNLCRRKELMGVDVTVEKRGGKPYRTRDHAMKEFSEKHLKSFCVSNSMINSEKLIRDIAEVHQKWVDENTLQIGLLDVTKDPITSWCEGDSITVECRRLPKIRKTSIKKNI